MPNFSRRSRLNLDQCHNDIIAVCNELILIQDFSVLFGKRTAEEQFDLYIKGRKFIGGKWKITNKNKVVTYCDGHIKKSDHQENEDGVSDAIDIVSYPINWKDTINANYLAGAFMGVAHRLKMQGVIESSFGWGGRWKRFKDLYHFYRIK